MEPILRWLVAGTLVALILAAGLEQPGLAAVLVALFALAAYAYIKLPEERR